MGTSKKHRPKSKLLSSTRPKVPTAAGTQRLSSQTTRSLIRNYHKLQKQLSQAQAANDVSLAASLQAQIDAQGGLERYQQASIQGQANDRGGDSSKVLMQWIKDAMEGKSVGEALPSDSDNKEKTRQDQSRSGPRKLDHTGSLEKLKMLEVGALKVDNAYARSDLFDMERIDLHSQHKDIIQQDFMDRPLPRMERLRDEGFDIISLSLVVNYVGDPVERGEMLMRTRQLFRYMDWNSNDDSHIDGLNNVDWREQFFPGLFFVLPAPCVLNSRYLDENRLECIMKDLGFELLRKKISSKLVYYYWRYLNPKVGRQTNWTKEQLRSGKSRNNFAICLS